MNGPCLCGDPCCPRCFPGSYQNERQYEHHLDHAEQWLPDAWLACQALHEEHVEEGAVLAEGILNCFICEASHQSCQEENWEDCPICEKEAAREAEPDDSGDVLSDREADDLATGYIAERLQDR